MRNVGGERWRAGLGPRFMAAVAVSLSLVYADSRLGNVTGELRNEIASTIVTPARFIARLPTAAWTTTSDYFKSRQELMEAKRELEEELLRERNRFNLVAHIERENEELRRLAGARDRLEPGAQIAEVINTASLPFINRIVIDKGSSQGIVQGQGVYSDEGVIGQLTRVDSETSQALLLTDKRFWVASRTARDGHLVLLQGDGGGRMRIRFVPSDVSLEKGDRLVTAGGAGPFPGGLPVAVVSNVWQPPGVPFLEGEALPVASIRQDSAVLVHVPTGERVPDTEIPVRRSGAVPANFSPEVLP